MNESVQARGIATYLFIIIGRDFEFFLSPASSFSAVSSLQKIIEQMFIFVFKKNCNLVSSYDVFNELTRYSRSAGQFAWLGGLC